MERRRTWRYGDQIRLARLAGCSNTQLNDIIHGRKHCHPLLATRLEKAAAELGYHIPRMLWCFEDMRAGNPLFQKRRAA